MCSSSSIQWLGTQMGFKGKGRALVQGNANISIGGGRGEMQISLLSEVFGVSGATANYSFLSIVYKILDLSFYYIIV